MKKHTQLTLCDSYAHSPVIAINKAKKIFEKVVKIYVERDDITNCHSTSTLFRGEQQIGDDHLLIVVNIDRKWWSPWKGAVTEVVYYLKK